MKEQPQNQVDESVLTSLHQEMGKVERQLSEVKIEHDAFATQIACLVMNTMTGSHQESSPTLALTACKTTNIPDPPMLTDGKEPQFND